jgi:hypothetical protein
MIPLQWQVLFVLQTKPPAAGAAYCYVGAEGGSSVGAGEATPVLGITAGRRESQSDASPSDKRRVDDVKVTHGLAFTEEKYERVKYESPLVKKLRELKVTDASFDTDVTGLPTYVKLRSVSYRSTPSNVLDLSTLNDESLSRDSLFVSSH